MAPQVRVKELEAMESIPDQARQAGVMALFYPGQDTLARLLLIVRPTYPGVHSGQVAFPGGGREPEDEDLLQTALRETREEVGVPEGDVQCLRPLSPLYIPPSNYTVSPHVGLCTARPNFRPDPEEVAGLIEVPVQELLGPENIVSRPMTTSYAHRIEVPAFTFQGHIVWGATAMILSELRSLLRQVV
ncbi:CoA pyrophosphatase [Robiginitalea sp. M366]|uniref:NUDIX hydrolase n=1 Tax=Robiginitalea aestuariiviva TaxID=3036903 RepID=UPI00240E62C8|nr:CoA pyrophosphatase [Robiginitalea aestuariiviva]MDG1572575.1 CoA pyrophosphatase [Robiginitalea aestuariiviva]